MTETLAPEQTVLTPTLRKRARGLVFWAVIALFALAIALITIGLTGTSQDAVRLSPDSPAPAGARGVVQVLRSQGVTVAVTSSLAETRTAAAISGPESTTILVRDTESLLDGAQLRSLGGLSSNVILLEPGFRQLNTLAPGVAQAGSLDSDVVLSADCALPVVQRAGTVSGGGHGYRLVPASADTGSETPTSITTACLSSGDGSDGGTDTGSDSGSESGGATAGTGDVYSLVRVVTGESAVTVLGASDALTNETIVTRGNAALALGVLGERASLIWYVPSLADVAAVSPPTLAELSPDWVVPTALLVFIVAIAAAFWRGRRFGPLVIENLPVVVRASETMEGRARLYQRSSARSRALDALRVGAIGRLATACGLPRTASVEEIVQAVASISGRPLDQVRTLLLDARPTSDRELIRLSDALLELETAVAAQR
ncbi:DUF4350 domain-containing protein [Glaciihabitans sp. dw_435]|uniref:DUF4350 domain-containing protein n=1 Tax=Glaciihabitans sp. dw_435 TaxID=2720081 RepID=UPI001BD69910|nr:DUF4350 domain-containing protein [Glaciihabitans sp. dw_435]